MPIKYQKWITRSDLKTNPEWRYVFGDNTRRVGIGGQAGSMRGEPNAIGVATKWTPGMAESDFFRDAPECFAVVKLDLERITAALKEGRWVVVPADGIGTGLSELPQRAPKLDAFIKAFWLEMEHAYPVNAHKR